MNKKKVKKVVVIKYEFEDIVLKIIVKGKGYVVEKIIEKVKDEDIFVYED